MYFLNTQSYLSNSLIIFLHYLYLSYSYSIFIQCLPYLDDNIVTKELEGSAINLLKGFDVSLDEAFGDTMQPIRVNLREVFVEEKRLGEGMFSIYFIIHYLIFYTNILFV